MKPVLTIIIALLCSCLSPATAQTTFAPAGADWYHHMNYGAFHCYNSGTTTILGKDCSTIKQLALTADPWKSMGLVVSNLATLNTYTSGDTVFVYNPVYSKFTPLYVFNVNEGDTVCLPHFYSNAGGPATDTTFCFRIDSVRMKLYDTAWLKTIYTHSYEYISMSSSDSVICSYGINEYGAYAERIGGIISGIYPHCLTCPVPLSESYQLPGGVRCYNDPSYAIKLVSGICGIPPTALEDVTTGQQVTVYPIPADASLNINAPAGSSAVLMTMDGRPVYSSNSTGSNIVIATASLPPGNYLLSIKDDRQHTIQQKRIVVVH